MPKHLSKFVEWVFGGSQGRQNVRNSKKYRNFAAPDTPEEPETPEPKPKTRKPPNIEKLKQKIEDAKTARLQRDAERQKVVDAAKAAYMEAFKVYLLKCIAIAHDRDLSSFKVGWLDFKKFGYDTQQTDGEEMQYVNMAYLVCAELKRGNLIKHYQQTPGRPTLIDIDV